MYNYIGILHKSSAVTQAISCNFLDNEASKLNLILSKSNIIEIYNITKKGLESTPYLNIYGNVILLKAVPSSNKTKDDLFILTEDLDYSIVTSQNNQIVNVVKGTIKEDIGKKQDIILSAVDNKKEIIVISAYNNIFKVINLRYRNEKTEQFKELTLRYDYDELLFISPFGTKMNNMNYSFGVIKSSPEDDFMTRTVSFETFSINTANSEILTYKQQQSLSSPNPQGAKDASLCYLDITLNPTVSLMISTEKSNNVILFFSNYVTYYYYKHNKLNDSNDQISYTDRKFVTYCVVDSENDKYLTVDDMGNLFLLAFKNYKLILQFLGEINYSSCITYLDNNYLFNGSSKANSQLIKVLTVPKEERTKPFIDIIEEYESLAPISDFAVVNNSKEENSIEILSVSGTDKNCSIKNIRKGTSLIFNGEIPLSGVKSVFLIKYIKNKNTMIIDDGNDDNKINCLIITTNYSSAIEVEGCYNVSLCDKLIFRKSIDDQVIYACNTVDGEIIIITKTSILYYNEYLELKIAKTFSNISPLLVKYHKKTNSIYVYFNNRTLQKLTINNNEIDYECILSNVEISAFDISNYFIVYSTWDSNTINLYSFSTKNIQCLCTVDDDFDVHTSSIQIIKKDGNKFIFISLSNGKMLYFKLKQQFRTLNSYTFSSEDFILKRKYNISTENFEIKKNKNEIDNTSCLFISTPIPSFAYLNKENPVISNFNIKFCKDIISLSSNNNYVFVFNDRITFGSLSNTQSQNVLTKKYGAQIYNLTMITLDKNIPFFTMIIETKNKSSFVLCDVNMNEITNFTFENDNEICSTFDVMKSSNNTSTISSTFTSLLNDKKYFILGTGIVDNISTEPVIGHLYLVELSMDTYKIKTLCDIETKGGVYKVAVDKNNIIYVAIGPSLYVYTIVENTNIFEFKLLRKCVDFSLINDLTFFNDYLVVSDIYRSISLNKYDNEKEKLNEICRDYHPVWIFAATQCNPSMLYVSDINANIVSLKKEEYPKSDEAKYKLERKAMFNLGERINKIVSTKIKGKDLKDIAILDENNEDVNVVYFGTLEGSIGVIIQLTKDTYELLSVLQEHILKKVMPNGGFEYSKWRANKDGFVSEDSIGFVEGSILSEFLNFDDIYRKEFLKEINYPWKKSHAEIINIIETLLKYH